VLSDLFAVVGDRIRAARQRKGVTQKELAAVVGLSRPSVANIESGNQNVQLGTLATMAAYFGVSIAELIGEVELNMPPRVVVIAGGYTVRCDDCGPVAAALTEEAADRLGSGHLSQEHPKTIAT
jgi:transcriptional regulator with XRE-family HTH domain